MIHEFEHRVTYNTFHQALRGVKIHLEWKRFKTHIYRARLDGGVILTFYLDSDTFDLDGAPSAVKRYNESFESILRNHCLPLFDENNWYARREYGKLFTDSYDLMVWGIGDLMEEFERAGLKNG